MNLEFKGLYGDIIYQKSKKLVAKQGEEWGELHMSSLGIIVDRKTNLDFIDMVLFDRVLPIM